MTATANNNADMVAPIILVGNSLGANLMTKYLGEEGFNESYGGPSSSSTRTLPKNVIAGVSRGNPLEIRAGNCKTPWAQLLAAGIKKTLVANYTAFRTMTCFHFQTAFRRALMSPTIGQLDDVMAPFLIRNEPIYPFATKIGGYCTGDDYWRDSSSNRYVAHVSVPLLLLSSMDDFLVTEPARRSLHKCLENPNVMVVKTKCGGHLGWQEAPPDGYFGTSSFADAMTVEFISAVLKLRAEEDRRDDERAQHWYDSGGGGVHERERRNEGTVESSHTSINLRSRL